MQSRLLETADLTFKKALKTAMTMELCEKETNTVRGKANAVNVNAINAQRKSFKKEFEKKPNSGNLD